MKKIEVLILIAFIFTIRVYADNTNPVVTNVAFSITGTTVTVTYDVTDTEQSTVTIRMEVSSNNGAAWDYNYGTASGHIGAGVTTGTGKTITWTYSSAYNDQFKIRIFANDETADGSPCATATVVYEGKTYNTVQIGTQCWLKENLDVGTRINGSGNMNNTGTIEKYCYGDLDANCTTYGGLYQWNEAMQYVTTPGTQGICPTGWHIPTYAQLQTLKTAVSNNGNALKKVGQGTGTNTSGFSALLAGHRAYDGTFSSFDAYFWSSTVGDATYANYTVLVGDNSNIYWYSYYMAFGFSVRCVKN